MKKEKTLTTLLLVIAVFMFTGLAYAYLGGALSNANKQTAQITTGTMNLTFADGSAELNATQMTIGESVTKTFTIENKGTLDAKASMYFKDLVNTYMAESMSYRLEQSTSENGTYSVIKPETNVPQSSTGYEKLLYGNITVPAGTKLYYKLIITFNNLPDVDQTQDIDAIFNTKFTLKANKPASDEAGVTLAALGLSAREGTPNFSDPATTDKGIFAAEDNYGTSYYFRGNVTNNTVQFGGTMPRSSFPEPIEDNDVDYDYYCYESSQYRLQCYHNYDRCSSASLEYEGYDMCSKNITINGSIIDQYSGEVYFDSIRITDYDDLSELAWCKLSTDDNYSTYNAYCYSTLEACEDSPFDSISGCNLSGHREFFVDWGGPQYNVYYNGEVLESSVPTLWKIIRINGDGTLRLILSSPVEAGYSYGQRQYVNSIAQSGLEEWYRNDLMGLYDDYISKSTMFCNDLNYHVEGSEDMYFYNVYDFYYRASNPSLYCNPPKANLNDGETQLTINNGLNHPIGLITADEVVMSGLTESGGNSYLNDLYYLDNGMGDFSSFTMTPYQYNENDFPTSTVYAFNRESLVWRYIDAPVSETVYLFPVINLNKEYARTLVWDSSKNAYIST